MIRDSSAGQWDMVIVHKLDRFARNRYDSAFYKRELRKAGCRLVSVEELKKYIACNMNPNTRLKAMLSAILMYSKQGK